VELLKLKAAVHRTGRFAHERCARDGVALARREHREPAAGACALDLFDRSIEMRRHHVPRHELDGLAAFVGQLDLVTPGKVSAVVVDLPDG
jgi:hypothetical protein